MQLWKLQIPSIIPEESKPFLEDRWLGQEGTPFYCLYAGIPLHHHWLSVIQDMRTSSPENLEDWYGWQEDRMANYYPNAQALISGFTYDVARYTFNVSDYPGAHVFGCVERIRYSDLG